MMRDAVIFQQEARYFATAWYRGHKELDDRYETTIHSCERSEYFENGWFVEISSNHPDCHAPLGIVVRRYAGGTLYAEIVDDD